MNYQIYGEPMPVVICNVDPGESLLCESGAMSWMSPNMQMQTVGGGAGKVLGRMFSGESMFQNRYTAQNGPGMIAFASSFPGSIRAVQITPDHPVVCQKKAFLASSEGVELSIFFQKKLGAGLFGGEGFVMQKLTGQGIAFLEIDGTTMEYNLGVGQQMVIDTGYLAMMDASVQMDVQSVKGFKNVMLGGESFFNTVVTGPGRVILQTMPMSNFVGAISALLPKK
jgi:uncharacterized protein (TIGR00266 family)